MKKFLRKAFPNRRRTSIKRKEPRQNGFLDSLAEGYELNMLDFLASGDQF